MVNVNFEHVSKRYEDGFEAVKGLNLEVQDGEFLVLLGPSGCGKSTTLRMLAGLEEVTDGTISIGGVSVNHLPAGARGLGMVFQSYALYPHMTIRDNMTFGLRMAKGKDRLSEAEINTRVKETANMVELSEHLGKKPKELSGGQRQRTALGRALLVSAPVLVLDDALASVDNNTAAAILYSIRSQEGRTIVMISHQLSAAAACDRILVMDNGRIVQQGHHNALIATAGTYRRLWERQQAAEQLEEMAS